MAFTQDLTQYETVSLPYDGKGKHFVIKKTVDFSDYPLAQNEILGLCDIPANVLVKNVYAYVSDTDTSVIDIDVGSFTTAGVAVDADGFIDGMTAASKAFSIGAGAYVSAGGYVSASAWSIGVTNNDADDLDDAVITFYIECIDLN